MSRYTLPSAGAAGNLSAAAPVSDPGRCPACDGTGCEIYADFIACVGAEGPVPGLGDLGPHPTRPEVWLYRLIVLTPVGWEVGR